MDFLINLFFSWWSGKKQTVTPPKRKFFPRMSLVLLALALHGCQSIPVESPGDRVHRIIRECRADLDSQIVASSDYERRMQANQNWGACIAMMGGGTDGPSNTDLAIQNGLILGNQLAPPVPPGRTWR